MQKKLRCLFIAKTKRNHSYCDQFYTKVEGTSLYLDQHVDVERNVFFMRLESELTNTTISLVS
jgi:hypothetical protein